MPNTPLIEIQDLSKSFIDKLAFNNISLSVTGGDEFGFPGPNGAGKTTTSKMIVGLLKPSAGSVKVAGFDIQSQPREAAGAR